MRDGASVQDASHESLWTYVACPTLVVDQTGIIRALSASAQALLPAATPGSPLKSTVDWLSPVHLQLVAPSAVPTSGVSSNAAGSVGRPQVRSPPRHAAERRSGLVSRRGHRSRVARGPVRAHPRARACGISARSLFCLMASLNIDRCREATVQLAARDLADAAVVVAPAGRGRRMPIFYCDDVGPSSSAPLMLTRPR